MEIQFLETNDNLDNYFKITKNTTYKEFIKTYKIGSKIYLSKNFLNISNSLYGNNKKETIKINKENCKQIIKKYKMLTKIIKWLKKNYKSFSGKFYVNTRNKQNNNDYMLLSMLQLKFTKPHFFRLSESLTIACNYLSCENALNNMCDFKNDICVNYRNKKTERRGGCCSTKCKFCSEGICKEKNISCKLFMCDYLKEKGYYFSPHTIPVLKQNLTYIDRLATHAVLFRSTKQCFKFAWFVRISSCIVFTLFFLYLILYLTTIF